MKASVDFFIAFLIVSWGMLVGVEVARTVLMMQHLHAYRDLAVYTIESHNEYTEDVKRIIDENSLCETCEIQVNSDKDRMSIVATTPIEMAGLLFRANLRAEGTAYIGK